MSCQFFLAVHATCPEHAAERALPELPSLPQQMKRSGVHHAEAPQVVAEAAAAAPTTPPTSSKTELFVHPAPADLQASLADHVGPVTPPPGSSSQAQPAPGSAQLSEVRDEPAQAGQPAQGEVKTGQVWL